MRPEALFPYPGLVLAALSGAASVALIFSNLRLGSITFAQQTLIMTTTLTIIVLLSSTVGKQYLCAFDPVGRLSSCRANSVLSHRRPRTSRTIGLQRTAR